MNIDYEVIDNSTFRVYCMQPEKIYITKGQPLTAFVFEKGWIYIWPAVRGLNGCILYQDEKGTPKLYLAVRFPRIDISADAILKEAEYRYRDASRGGCDPIDDEKFAIFDGLTPEEFLAGYGKRAKELLLMELPEVDFPACQAPKKRCYYIGYAGFKRQMECEMQKGVYGFVTLQDIQIAELAGEAPEYVEGLRRFRLSRYEHYKQEEMRRKEKRKQLAQEKAAQQLREAEEKIAAAETVIRESGALNNDHLEIPREG